MNLQRVTRYFLIFDGLILLGYAAMFLIKPTMLGELVGFTHHSPNTLVEVTAFYGGLELGMAIFFFWGAANTKRYPVALMAFFIIFLFAGLGRLLGIILYGFEDPSQPIVTGVEILAAFFALWLRMKLAND